MTPFTPLPTKYECSYCSVFSIRNNTKHIIFANILDLTEAEDIKNRWPEHTEGLYKKDLHDPYNHDGVITHLELDMLKCEVRWTLEGITTNKAT